MKERRAKERKERKERKGKEGGRNCVRSNQVLGLLPGRKILF